MIRDVTAAISRARELIPAEWLADFDAMCGDDRDPSAAFWDFVNENEAAQDACEIVFKAQLRELFEGQRR